jgi:hypothetical protein
MDPKWPLMTGLLGELLLADVSVVLTIFAQSDVRTLFTAP